MTPKPSDRVPTRIFEKIDFTPLGHRDPMAAKPILSAMIVVPGVRGGRHYCDCCHCCHCCH